MRIIDLWVFLLIIIQRLFPALFTPQAIVSGIAKTVEGTPLAGVALTLTNKDTGDVYNAVSDKAGAFTFQPAKGGNYALDGYKDNGDGSHYSGSVDLVLGTANVSVDVALVKTIASFIVSPGMCL